MNKSIRKLPGLFLTAALMVSVSVSANEHDNLQSVKDSKHVHAADSKLQNRRIKIAHIDEHDYEERINERAAVEAESVEDVAETKVESAEEEMKPAKDLDEQKIKSDKEDAPCAKKNKNKKPWWKFWGD